MQVNLLTDDGPVTDTITNSADVGYLIMLANGDPAADTVTDGADIPRNVPENAGGPAADNVPVYAASEGFH